MCVCAFLHQRSGNLYPPSTHPHPTTRKTCGSVATSLFVSQYYLALIEVGDKRVEIMSIYSVEYGRDTPAVASTTSLKIQRRRLFLLDTRRTLPHTVPCFRPPWPHTPRTLTTRTYVDTPTHKPRAHRHSLTHKHNQVCPGKISHVVCLVIPTVVSKNLLCLRLAQFSSSVDTVEKKVIFLSC